MATPSDTATQSAPRSEKLQTQDRFSSRITFTEVPCASEWAVGRVATRERRDAAAGAAAPGDNRLVTRQGPLDRLRK
jgi:hypothetical protein